jgi:uncharacterized integral membrane protein
MPWRLLVFIIICAVFLAFITFNLENKCDISFGIKVFKDIPVFLTIFVSFMIGLLCALPFALKLKKKNKETPQKDRIEMNDSYSETNEKIKQDAAAARERFFAKRRGGK